MFQSSHRLRLGASRRDGGHEAYRLLPCVAPAAGLAFSGSDSAWGKLPSPRLAFQEPGTTVWLRPAHRSGRHFDARHAMVTLRLSALCTWYLSGGGGLPRQGACPFSAPSRRLALRLPWTASPCDTLRALLRRSRTRAARETARRNLGGMSGASHVDRGLTRERAAGSLAGAAQAAAPSSRRGGPSRQRRERETPSYACSALASTAAGAAALGVTRCTDGAFRAGHGGGRGSWPPWQACCCPSTRHLAAASCHGKAPTRPLGGADQWRGLAAGRACWQPRRVRLVSIRLIKAANPRRSICPSLSSASSSSLPPRTAKGFAMPPFHDMSTRCDTAATCYLAARPPVRGTGLCV